MGTVLERANQVLDDVEREWLSPVHSKKGVETISDVKNIFLDVPPSLGSKNVEYCHISSTKLGVLKYIVSMPKNSKIKPHWHEKEQERVTVISGQVSFAIYADENLKCKVKSGTLEEGESVTISAMSPHCYLTTKTGAYLLAEMRSDSNEYKRI